MKDILIALVGKTIARITIDEETSMLKFFDAEGKVLFTCDSDAITDEEGDEFDCDNVLADDEAEAEDEAGDDE